MRGHANANAKRGVNLHGMAQAAVKRSAGRCEAFWGESARSDRFLLFLGRA